MVNWDAFFAALLLTSWLGLCWWGWRRTSR